MVSNEINDPEKIGILLVSHGSRLPESTETITRLADMYRAKTECKISVAYMELREPNIPQAMNELVKGTEIEKVIVVPVFLSHGMHTTRDIPKILGLIDDNEEKIAKNHSNDHNNNHNHNHNHNHSHDHSHSHNHSHDFEKVDFDGEIIYTEPLGADPLIAEIIKNRVNSALE